MRFSGFRLGALSGRLRVTPSARGAHRATLQAGVEAAIVDRVRLTTKPINRHANPSISALAIRSCGTGAYIVIRSPPSPCCTSAATIHDHALSVPHA